MRCPIPENTSGPTGRVAPNLTCHGNAIVVGVHLSVGRSQAFRFNVFFVCVGSGDAVAGDERRGSWHQLREELFIDFWEAVNGTIELCGEAATVYILALGQAPQIVIGSVARETPAFRCSRVGCKQSIYK